MTELGDVERLGVELAHGAEDETRLATELTEAWVPVRTGYGDGVLVFANSD